MVFEHPFEMAADHLKLKYRAHKPKNPNRRQNYNGNSGTPVRGTPPRGLPRQYRGKTKYR
jgi:hypothetical protein